MRSRAPRTEVGWLARVLLVAAACAFVATRPLPGQVVVKDRFGRVLNDRHITLVDWQGHVENPMIQLDLHPPSDVPLPLTVTIRARGTSRLKLDRPSTLSARGAKKVVRFQRDAALRIFLGIAPDRAGRPGSIERYSLQLESTAGKQTIPIRVIDQDDDLKPLMPVHFDYRFDDIERFFARSSHRKVAESAVKDWLYFFRYRGFDTVQRGEESLHLAGNGFTGHVRVENDKPFRGLWIFMRSFGGPYSTGYPSANGRHHTIDGKTLPGPLHRSGALLFHVDKAKPIVASIKDRDWYRADPHKVTDLYSICMHEFGHAIVYASQCVRMNRYKEGGFRTAHRVIDYQGVPVPLDDSYHIPADRQFWDRISGQNGGWDSVFPVRRWMITKLALLHAAEAGWPLREIGPFLPAEIVTKRLPPARRGSPYTARVQANGGGVPFYHWSVLNGALPQGLTIDTFTGTIAGTPLDASESRTFTVELKDYDPRSTPKTAVLRIDVR